MVCVGWSFGCCLSQLLWASGARSMVEAAGAMCHCGCGFVCTMGDPSVLCKKHNVVCHWGCGLGMKRSRSRHTTNKGFVLQLLCFLKHEAGSMLLVCCDIVCVCVVLSARWVIHMCCAKEAQIKKHMLQVLCATGDVVFWVGNGQNKHCKCLGKCFMCFCESFVWLINT